MMCVKLTLPPRERARWLLMTTRLSMSSLAGTARTLVAVGTVSETSMLDTTREDAPRSGVTTSSLTGPVPLTAGMSRGLGASAAGSGFGSAFVSGWASGLGSGLGSVFASVAAGTVASVLGSATGWDLGAAAGGAAGAGAPLPEPLAAGASGAAEV